MCHADGISRSIDSRPLHDLQRWAIGPMLAVAAMAGVGCDSQPVIMPSQPIVMPSPSVSEIPVVAFAGKPIRTSPGLVVLPVHEPGPTYETLYGDTLLREIVRQALLVSARDELGQSTRDGCLRESLPEGSGGAPAAVSVVSLFRPTNGRPYDPPSSVEIIVFRGEGENREGLFQQRFEFGDQRMLEQLVAQAEVLSRQEFVAALRRTGVQGAANKRADHSDVAAEVDSLLGQTELVSQFAAVRMLHSAVRDEGESPERLGALVRGYAQLGLLCECLIAPADKAFKARGLVYAERLVARDPKSPWGLWHRAFARALAGVHRGALADLAQARELVEAGPADVEQRVQPPPWVEAIDAYCRFDRKTLTGIEDDGCVRLARLLRLRTFDGSRDGQRIVEAAGDVLTNSPDCYLAIDAIYTIGKLGTGHATMAQSHQVAGRHLYRRVLAVPGLPNAVGEVARNVHPGAEFGGDPFGMPIASAGEIESRLKLVEALRTAGAAEGDLREPSWQVLASLIEEVSFLHSVRTANFLRFWLSVPVDETLDQLMPLVAGHPLRPLFESHSNDRNRIAKCAAEMRQGIDLVNLDAKAYPLLGVLRDVDSQVHATLLAAALSRSDFVYHDEILLLQGRAGNEAQHAAWARSMLDLSPSSPMAAAHLIERDWAAAEAGAADWETRYQDFSDVQASLGWRYAELERWEDAQRCWQRVVELLHDEQAYEGLASVYWKQEKFDEWKAALEEFLTHETLGLGHAEARVQIADFHMERREWDAALPYAEEAAQTYAAWALMCAARCHEALGHWDEAERYTQAASQRYADRQLAWYYFCKRTGHGDIDAAREVALEFIRRDATGEVAANPYAPAVFFMLERQPQQALAKIRRVFDESSNPFLGLEAALLAEELGDVAGRSMILAQIAKSGHLYNREATGKPRPELIRLAELIATDLKQGGKADFEIAKIDEIFAETDAWEQLGGYYFAARYLDRHGKPELANELWRRHIASTGLLDVHRTLAGSFLVERGVNADEFVTLLEKQP